ncbi:MFS transporter [Rhizobium rhizosphaerae]
MTEQESGKSTAPSRAAIWGWMLFDCAAQPFFTVVTTFIFGPYFVARLAADPQAGQAWWSLMLTITGIVIAVLSPILGALADQTGGRKRWIGALALVKIVSLFGLWFAAPGSGLMLGFVCMIFATLAAEFSIVFNDAMMPRLVPPAEVGRVSNLAWGIGYLGGMVVLIVVILFLAGNPATGRTLIGIEPLFGLDAAKGEDARITGPIAALWYALFILPMFLFTPDPRIRGHRAGAAIRNGLSELKQTILSLRNRPGLTRFLVARMLFQDGVNGLIALGGAFAAGMFGWGTTELGLFGIILNVVAIGGCLAAGRLDRMVGAKRLVVASLICLVIATLGIVGTGPGFTAYELMPLSTDDLGGLFGTAAEKAYILYGLLIGLAFGPVQASARAYLARSVSPQEAGRIFGLYALTGRATSFLAPAAVGLVTVATGSARLGMATLILFLVAGLILLATTPYPAERVKDGEGTVV